MIVVKYFFKINSAFGWDKGRVKYFMNIQKKFFSIDREVDRFMNNMKKYGLKESSNILFPIQFEYNNLNFIFNNEKKNIALLIGGKVISKKWPISNWIELINKMQNDVNIYLVGGADEVNEAEQILNNIECNNCISVCGKLNIAQTASFLKQMDKSISLDTGAMHLSYAVGTPVIALMSTRDLTNKWYPYGKRNTVIEKVLDCSFCLKNNCEDNLCMKNISVDEVFERYKELD